MWFHVFKVENDTNKEEKWVSSNAVTVRTHLALPHKLMYIQAKPCVYDRITVKRPKNKSKDYIFKKTSFYFLWPRIQELQKKKKKPPCWTFSQECLFQSSFYFLNKIYQSFLKRFYFSQPLKNIYQRDSTKKKYFVHKETEFIKIQLYHNKTIIKMFQF